VVPTVVHGHAGEGRADSVVPGCFNAEEERDAIMEEERGDGVEAHAEEGAWWWAHGGGGREGAGADGCVARK
jgi:hypothetical protein